MSNVDGIMFKYVTCRIFYFKSMDSVAEDFFAFQISRHIEKKQVAPHDRNKFFYTMSFHVLTLNKTYLV